MKRTIRLLGATAFAVAAVQQGALVMGQPEIPADAPDDAVMASPVEVQQMLGWASTAFTGTPSPGGPPRVELLVRRQDHNVLCFGESCMETPLRIGERRFKHGLGTHANSEIVVKLPQGTKAFQAFVGVDNNDDTGGKRGSVQFAVDVRGKEVFRTPTVRGGQAPVDVSVDVPPGVDEIVLKVDTTADGVSHDQADWADARLLMQDGSVSWLDENQLDLLFLTVDPPFSFKYGGASSAQLLKTWKRTVERKDRADRIEYTVGWTDPETSLHVGATAGVFKRYPAVDWVLSFENRGSRDTPVLEDIQAADVGLRTGLARRNVVVHHLMGDACGERSFLPVEAELAQGGTLRLAPTGGRPSSISAFPFFNVQYRDRGIITAIGWSGQWAASFERAATGPTRLRAGMEKTHLVLHPGERIRSPRILMLTWRGDRQAAHNRFRRLMLFHYVPKRDGRPVQMPIALQCFDRYSWTRAEWATQAGQIAAAEFAKKIGCDHHWLDAAWFIGGFPNGVGNWTCKPKAFANGLKPVSDACHRLGLRFVLWFEPERVATGTQIAREHPEFVFGGARGGLFRLNDPAARRWLTDLLSKRIDEFGVDVYRNDFNIDPLGFWRSNDTPDRQGMTEIRYVEGHYEMWDELLARHPGLLIDNCSSGGRRIDLETCMRSVPLWRSDTSCSPGHPDWNQAQSHGLSLYIPLHTACGWTPDPYEFRSSATGGAICQFAYLDSDFPVALATATIAEARANRRYWYGDFYPLTPCTTTPAHWSAYQFHRPDLGAGLVLVFRRGESGYTGLEVALKGLEPGATYEVESIDDDRKTTTETMTGQSLMSSMELRLGKKGSSLLVRYRKSAAVDGARD